MAIIMVRMLATMIHDCLKTGHDCQNCHDCLTTGGVADAGHDNHTIGREQSRLKGSHIGRNWQCICVIVILENQGV